MPPSDTHERFITVDGRERKYLVHTPPAARRRGRAPLLVLLHGGGGTPLYIAHATGFLDHADRQGFIVALPEAVRADDAVPPRFLRNPTFWNDGSGRGRAGRENIDDVSFICEMVDEVCRECDVDPRRIFAAGFSNGASMAIRLGLERPQRFAAIGAVAGTIWLRDIRPARPPSLIYITGTADPLNPIEGGRYRSPWGLWEEKQPLRSVIERWCDWIGAERTPASTSDENGVRFERFVPHDSDRAVELYMIRAAGHVWPGGQPVLAERLVGARTDKLDATRVIWDFFERCPATNTAGRTRPAAEPGRRSSRSHPG